jgi:hypothetical protein
MMPVFQYRKAKNLWVATALRSFIADDPKQPEFKDRPYTAGEYRGGTLMTEDDDGNMALLLMDGDRGRKNQAYFAQLRRNEKTENERKLLTDYEDMK